MSNWNATFLDAEALKRTLTTNQMIQMTLTFDPSQSDDPSENDPRPVLMNCDTTPNTSLQGYLEQGRCEWWRPGGLTETDL